VEPLAAREEGHFMRKLFASAWLLGVLAAVSASAQPANPYLWMCFDEYGAYCQCKLLPTPLYSIVDCWVWVLPSGNGMMCAEFGIEWPANVVPMSISVHPDLACAGDPGACESPYCFTGCKTGWTWVLKRSIMFLNDEQATARFIPDPSSGILAVRTCAPGNPAEACVTAPILLNVGYCPYDAVERSTWGSIKSLYR
jgi:hypothetical protein